MVFTVIFWQVRKVKLELLLSCKKSRLEEGTSTRGMMLGAWIWYSDTSTNYSVRETIGKGK
tara:strand:- start:196 stop:378 length:183 start_codon:yes stop_codon:yes gene_type:complete